MGEAKLLHQLYLIPFFKFFYCEHLHYTFHIQMKRYKEDLTRAVYGHWACSCMSSFFWIQNRGIQDPSEIIFEMSKEERKDFYRSIAWGLNRPLFAVYRRVLRMYDNRNHVGKWVRRRSEAMTSARFKSRSRVCPDTERVFTVCRYTQEEIDKLKEWVPVSYLQSVFRVWGFDDGLVFM